MRICRLVLILLLGAAPCAMACSQLQAGTSFWVRLSGPISSYSAQPGTPVHGTLLESPLCDGASLLPIHIPVEGFVVSAHRVGLGLVHETATLQIEFRSIKPGDAPPIEIHGQVAEVDNAREAVKKGVIHGIRSTETPQGEISSRLKYLPSWHLYPDPFLMGYKLLFPVFPEPEIYLPAGTDLRVELLQDADLPAELTPPAPIPSPAENEEQDVAATLNQLPARTVDKKHREADLIDMAFVGSKEELMGAFEAAGWKRSDTVSGRTILHQFRAFLAKTSYSSAPMSRQWFTGREPDMTLEKTFDSYGKRDHLRIWRLEQTAAGAPLWAAAAVRETGATLSVKQLGFMHHVSEDLDEERESILRDLVAADCVKSESLVDRPAIKHVMVNATGELLRTDGRVMMLHLKTCDTPGNGGKQAESFRPGSRFSRYLRKEILTVRSDLFRANAVYALFDLTAITVKFFRHNSASRAEMRSVEAQASPVLGNGYGITPESFPAGTESVCAPDSAPCSFGFNEFY